MSDLEGRQACSQYLTDHEEVVPLYGRASPRGLHELASSPGHSQLSCATLRKAGSGLGSRIAMNYNQLHSSSPHSYY